MDGVSLVIPGKNCSRTIRECLGAVVPMLTAPGTRLREIIFVDDGSTDETPRIVAEYPVRFIQGPAGGPGAARNVGWRAAVQPLVWFIDSDCIARADALELLLAKMDDEKVGAVGGSYDNQVPHSLLGRIIHEEIMVRHSAMGAEVNFLGGFNVLYRRHVLEEVSGFDERYFNGPGSPGAEDAELGYRAHAAGYVLRFEFRSKVGHYHPTRFWRYMRTQRHHGYWRANLHFRHPHTAGGDAYSSVVDHAQPVLAMASVGCAAAAYWPIGRMALAGVLGLLVLAQLPMTLRLLSRTGSAGMVCFAPMGIVRAFARGMGMTVGVLVNWLRMV